MTPHNEAQAGDYASTVLLSGDPLRSEWIAETFFDDPRCVNRIRGALGYTGSYQGVPVSVQTTGIGIPSLSIYVHELLETYGAKVLLRVGTCGALQDYVRLRDIVISQTAGNDSGAEDQAFGAHHCAPSPDLSLLSIAADAARKSGVRHHVGPTASSDVFYHPAGDERFRPLREHNVLAVDMETSGLYTLAARFGARALSICMVVDNVFTHDAIAEAERQAVFRPMIELALAAASQAFRQDR